MTQTPLLELKNLQVSFSHFDQTTQTRLWRQAVKDVSFKIHPGEILALVGESGSGKSVSAMSIIDLFTPGSTMLDGTLQWRNQTTALAEHRSPIARGQDVGVIFQEPMTSLNPLHKIIKQLNEIQLIHQDISTPQASKRSLELLDWVGMPDPQQKLLAYPHELSGGQRQRVMIAMALANQPSLLIADEPTTALDVTIQQQVIQLLQRLQQESQMAILFISHDLHLVQRIADRVVVMHEGKSIETNQTQALFAAPKQTYTQTLVNAIPRGKPPAVESQEQLLRLDQLKVWFPIKAGLFKKTIGYVKAVQPIDMTIMKGMTYGIVGESGSGKTTLGMALLRLIESEGGIYFGQQAIDQWDRQQMRPLRRQLQVVFQDPYSSLSPRMTVQEMLEEGLVVHGVELGMPTESKARKAWLTEQVTQTLEQVEMDPIFRTRYPHEFSGGQRQRIAIARALILRPIFIVLDEPTSALDRTTQQQLISLLLRLQQQQSLTYLFISHDLSVIRAMSHYIFVMKEGEVVEHNQSEQLFTAPQHPYTQALLEAALFTGIESK